MLTPEEKKELEQLEKDPIVKLGRKITRPKPDPERQKLAQLRFFRRKGLEALNTFKKEK